MALCGACQEETQSVAAGAFVAMATICFETFALSVEQLESVGPADQKPITASAAV